MNSVRLNALVLASPELNLGPATLVDELASKAISGGTALAEAELDKPALPGEDLGRKLPAVFARHRPFDALDDGRDGTAVVLKLLGTILDADPRTLANVLVVGALVGILKPTPAAHVVDEDHREVGIAALDIVDELLERVSAIEAEPTAPLIGIGAHDLNATAFGILPDGVGLILDRVLLVLGGHAHVLGGAYTLIARVPMPVSPKAHFSQSSRSFRTSL